MKIKIFTVAVVFMAGMACFLGKSQSVKNGLSDLQKENVEALANDEGDQNTTCRWSRVFDSHGCVFHVCVKNGSGDVCSCGDTEG